MPLFIEKPGEYLTAKEAADLLGISKVRMVQFTRSGKLPSVGAQGTRLVHRDDFEAFRQDRITRKVQKVGTVDEEQSS